MAEENENDIFLKPTHNFEGNDKIKLNDDLIGSNEQAGAVIIKNEESVLITYQDEIGNWGRSVDLEGNLSENELALPSTDGEFFNDGAFLSFWKQGKKAGFSVFDEFFNVLTTKSILEVVDYAWSLQTAGKIINDSTFYRWLHMVDVFTFTCSIDRDGKKWPLIFTLRIFSTLCR